MYRKTEDGMFLLGGALLGAAAMYLLDPEAGRRRREQLSDLAGEAAHDYGAKFGAAVEAVRERAGDVRHSDTVRGLGRRLSQFGGRVSDYGSRAAEGTRSAASLSAEKARDWTGRAGDAIGSPRSWFGYEEERHYGRTAAAYSATGIGALLAGCGLMFLLDPQRGRQRRAVCLDKARSIVNRTGRTFNTLGRDLANRAYGTAVETRGRYMEGDSVSADQLLHRVRSELGHATRHASAIQVMTDNQGTVTLHGRALRGELEPVLACVRGVVGVNEVVNLLTVCDTADALNDPTTNPVTASPPQM